ncbi:MAG: hypothetical protein V2J26_13145 [Pacificimonas sp.]|jgi:uncharacterized repeat protein (TIGR01451 family)|nr:hypothetical protein [Pacificimonas sp.]
MALVALIAGAAPVSAATTIRNIATLSWTSGDERLSVESNETRLQVNRTTNATIALLREFPGIDGLAVPDDSTQCLAAGGEFALLPLQRNNATLSAASTGPQPAAALPNSSLKPTLHFRAGEPVFISVTDRDQNEDPLLRDSIEVLILSSGGDEERLRLFETGADTGTFIGGMPTNSETPPTLADCILLLRRGDTLRVRYADGGAQDEWIEAEALVDPLGFVFDSQTGDVVNGATVRLVDALTGAPAQAFGDDGVTPYPSVMVTGESVVDDGGLVYPAVDGGYRFPFAAQGRYRLIVEPPDDYSAPSTAAPADLEALVSPDGVPFVVREGSYGGPFALVGPEPLRIDIPVDPPGPGDIRLQKAVSVAQAEAGDFVQYRVTATNADSREVVGLSLVDEPAPGFRFVSGSVRVEGVRTADPDLATDGAALRFELPAIAPGEDVSLTYLLAVGARALPGRADNIVRAFSGEGSVGNTARASLIVRDPLFTDAATLIGRVSAGECGAGDRAGVGGVRILMQDGRYVLTDADGLYSFQGVEPGTHVVQLDVSALPDGYEVIACERNSRRAGRAFSSFVEVQGGGLWRTDFVLRQTGEATEDREEPVEANPLSDAEAAGSGRDWLADSEPGTGLLFPEAGHNPRSPAQRVVVKHLPAQSVAITINGRESDPLAFDGKLGGPERGVSVSRWRGLPLVEGRNEIVATISNEDGSVADTLTREIWYTNQAVRAEIIEERSRLTADGRTRPRIAVRFTDARGNPVRSGAIGAFSIDSPYRPATALDRQQARQLAGLDRFQPTWRVEGDDGIAFIELEPTVQTGTALLRFTFETEEKSYEQRLETWLEPGEQPFVLVGYAAGTTGFNTLRDRRDALIDDSQATQFTDGEVKLFAKGRVLGKWLVTLAIDSEREERRGERRRLLQQIDPNRYYTVYGDGSEQRFAAPTSDRLYLRIERDQFYAMYGDFETGLNQTELTRYNRTLTGAKAEYRGKNLSFNGFAADTGLRFRREEIQGNGLSGPYEIGARDLVLNSEKVVIEVRDRFRSNIIVSREEQTRFIDYTLDPASGTIRFKRPILSRDENLNSVFIVVDYETETSGEQRFNGGGRAALSTADRSLEVGASFIRDDDETAETNLYGADARWRPEVNTEIRAEYARTDADARDFGSVSGKAWLVEAEHHGERIDASAYIREQDAAFGVGQLNAAEIGTRKMGADAQARVTDRIALRGQATREEALVGSARREALFAEAEYRTGGTRVAAGLRTVADTGVDGGARGSDLVTLAGSQQVGRLTVEGSAELALGGKDDSVDYPSRYRAGLRYALKPGVDLVASHEIADGGSVEASNTRVGVDLQPWAGADLGATLGQEQIRENGNRSFANLGLRQNILLGERWGLDVTFEANRTLSGGLDPGAVTNVFQPVASGGFLGGAPGTISEDFWAATVGGTYRTETLSWTGRVEHRDGDRDSRTGFTTSILRQTKAGIALAGQATLFKTDTARGEGTSAALSVSGAYRPLGSRWAILDRLEFDLEDVSSGQLPGPFAGAGARFGADGGKSRRIVNNLAVNYMSGAWTGRAGEVREGRAQASLYWGAKYVFDRYQDEDYEGFAQAVALDARFDLTESVDLGLAASVRHVASGPDTISYSVGPNVGLSPIDNAWLSVGYNIAGYHDEDFSEARYTRDGPYVTFRLKLDQLSPEALFGK